MLFSFPGSRFGCAARRPGRRSRPAARPPAERLEDRSLLSATFALDGDSLDIDAVYTALWDDMTVREAGATYEFALSTGTWSGSDGGGVAGAGTSVLRVEKAAVAGLADGIDVDASAVSMGIELATADFSGLSGKLSVASGWYVTVSGVVEVSSLRASAARSVVVQGRLAATAGSIELAGAQSVDLIGAAIETTSAAVTLSGNRGEVQTRTTSPGVSLLNSSIRTETGAITISGRAGAKRGTGYTYGVVFAGSSVESTGTRGAAEISITGDDGSGEEISVAAGVQLYDPEGGPNTITSVSGEISVIGSAGSAYSHSTGVIIARSAVASTGVGPDAGRVTIRGVAQNSAAAAAGVFLGTGAVTTTVDGDLSISGEASGTGDFVHGVYAESAADAAVIAASGSADVAISGTAGGGVGPAAAGIELWGQVSVAAGAGDVALEGRSGGAGAGLTLDGATVSSALGDVRVAADSMALDGSLDAAAGEVRLSVISAGRAIDVGGNDSAGTLGLSDPELDRVSAQTVTVGSATAGPVTVSAAVTPQASSLFRIVSGGSVTIAADLDLRGTPGASFEVQSGAAVAQTNGADVHVAPLYPPTSGAAGSLDPTFDGDGVAMWTLICTAMNSVVQPDGKILLVGGQGVARLLPNGAPDPAFGFGGFAAVYGGRDVAVQPDGKIVVAGTVDGNMMAARLNPDGTPDESFGGTRTVDFGSTDLAWAVGFQADGKVLVGGFVGGYGGGDFALARFNVDGTPDASFGNAGRAITDFGTNVDFAADMLVRPDGRIILVGGDGGNFAIAQYNPDGSLDATFGTGGRVSVDIGGPESARSAALLPDGRFVVGGPGPDRFHLARFNPDGSLDRTFGVGGRMVTNVGHIADDPGIALQADGGVVMVGDATGEIRVVRYKPDGTLDTAYQFSPLTGDGEAVAIQPDGKIVVVGGHYYGKTYAARLNAPPPGLASIRYSATGDILIGPGSTAATGGGDVTLTSGGNISLGETSVVGTASGRAVLSAEHAATLDGEVRAPGGTSLLKGTLAGRGVVVGLLSLDPGATLSPGGPGRAAMTLGGLTLLPGSAFRADLVGLSPGTGHDQVIISGVVALGGATLTLSVDAGALAAIPPAARRFVLIANDGTDGVSGTFAGLPEGALVTAAGLPFRITYRGGVGNDVVLVADLPPVATADRVRVREDGTATVNVLANDSDPEGRPLRVVAPPGEPFGVWAPLASGARLMRAADGTFTYDPNGAFDRLRPGDTFVETITYVVADEANNQRSGALKVVVYGRGAADLIGYSGGEWHVAASDGSAFADTVGATWANVRWTALKTGDFDGDGRADVLGLYEGEWYVGLARTAGSGLTYFSTRLWAKWNAAAAWEHVLVGDLDGDGKDDVVAEAGGAWYGATSNGSAFLAPKTLAGTSDPAWDLASLADATGDGKDDLVLVLNGDWYVGAWAGATFGSVVRWARMGAGAYELLTLADLNADGKADAVGFAGGEWRVGTSNGASAFAVSLRAKWANVTWLDPLVGDFDGDGFTDLAARYGGHWYVGLSDAAGGERSRSLWASWNNLAWKDVRAGDFDGDGRADIAGRYDGEWYVARSTGGGFATSRWGRWAEASWRAVTAGDADGSVPPVSAGTGVMSTSSATTSATALRLAPTAAAFAAEDEPLTLFWSSAGKDEELAAGLLSI